MPSYHAAHRAVARLRGRASQHDCVDCEQRAQEWTFTYPEGFEPLRGESGRAKNAPYSLDPDHYEPRCRSCHAAFDRVCGHVANKAVPHPGAKGVNHYSFKSSKLTENDVLAIRVLLTKESERKVASRFGIPRSTLRSIKHKVGLWAYVEEII